MRGLVNVATVANMIIKLCFLFSLSGLHNILSYPWHLICGPHSWMGGRGIYDSRLMVVLVWSGNKAKVYLRMLGFESPLNNNTTVKHGSGMGI